MTNFCKVTVELITLAGYRLWNGPISMDDDSNTGTVNLLTVTPSRDRACVL